MGMREAPLLINGTDVWASNGARFERRDPLSNLPVSSAAAASTEDVHAAVSAAARAFPSWSATGPGARRQKLLKAADCLHAREADIVAAMTDETGATAAWARENVELGAEMLREAALMTTHVGGQIIPSDRPGATAFALRCPVGVVAGIAPWNAPIVLGVRAIAAPLACGNTVVLKSSELCPVTQHIIGEALCAAGLGGGIVNVISNAPPDADKVVEALVAHPAVRRVNFTGSTRVGRLVAEVAARYLKPVVLELGGKAPLIVLDDADLEEAARAAAYGAFMKQGQICMATERIVVDAPVADAFVALLGERAAALVAGDPHLGRAPLGSVIGQEAVRRIEGLVQDAVLKGARLVIGSSARGTLIDATVLDHVTPAMRIYDEESFGPVIAVVRVNGVEEAVRVANDTEYGLAAAVFGRDLVRALSVAQRIEAGICHVNAATFLDEPQMPLGGVKASGYGRLGGSAGIQEFTDLRWITVTGQPGDYPL